MSGPETGGPNFVDLTLDDRFGYNRKTPFGRQVDICGVKSEELKAAETEFSSKRCWEKVDWHKRQMEERKDVSVDDGRLVCFCTN